MGYETKLIIGAPTRDADKDGDIYFFEYASIDLCKTGDSFISQIDWQNRNAGTIAWYWYENEKKVKKDCYEESSMPVPINIVIDALKKDIKESEYRRFKWALALLESMQDDNEKLSVLFYGH